MEMEYKCMCSHDEQVSVMTTYPRAKPDKLRGYGMLFIIPEEAAYEGDNPSPNLVAEARALTRSPPRNTTGKRCRAHEQNQRAVMELFSAPRPSIRLPMHYVTVAIEPDTRPTSFEWNSPNFALASVSMEGVILGAEYFSAHHSSTYHTILSQHLSMLRDISPLSRCFFVVRVERGTGCVAESIMDFIRHNVHNVIFLSDSSNGNNGTRRIRAIASEKAQLLSTRLGEHSLKISAQFVNVDTSSNCALGKLKEGLLRAQCIGSNPNRRDGLVCAVESALHTSKAFVMNRHCL